MYWGPDLYAQQKIKLVHCPEGNERFQQLFEDLIKKHNPYRTRMEPYSELIQAAAYSLTFSLLAFIYITTTGGALFLMTAI